VVIFCQYLVLQGHSNNLYTAVMHSSHCGNFLNIKCNILNTTINYVEDVMSIKLDLLNPKTGFVICKLYPYNVKL